MKKAQVSLEYLSTYSWAIIILLTIISILSYFGFFNEGALIRTECESGAFLECQDSQLIDNGGIANLSFKLRNNMKADIILTKIELVEFPEPIGDCSGISDVSFARGELKETPGCTINTEFKGGDIEELSFVLWYKKDEALSVEHYINGGLKTQVRSS